MVQAHLSKLCTDFSHYFQDIENKSERLDWVLQAISFIVRIGTPDPLYSQRGGGRRRRRGGGGGEEETIADPGGGQGNVT
ncbi:hypothetical protein F7725_020285 [Dissostichus mawsoni]|uniref:Uncharacterized protein n=1 Tax=Dissostichus mawsoni TaxID=36200 RepID=A0A7J5YFE8_DISMA|nr:hypothetical protein F7725_020285 [Dissostichus mawsoni]